MNFLEVFTLYFKCKPEKVIGNWYLVFGNFHLSGLCSPWLGLEDFLTFTFVNDKYQVVISIWYLVSLLKAVALVHR